MPHLRFFDRGYVCDGETYLLVTSPIHVRQVVTDAPSVTGAPNGQDVGCEWRQMFLWDYWMTHPDFYSATHPAALILLHVILFCVQNIVKIHGFTITRAPLLYIIWLEHFTSKITANAVKLWGRRQDWIMKKWWERGRERDGGRGRERDGERWRETEREIGWAVRTTWRWHRRPQCIANVAICSHVTKFYITT